MPYQVTSDASGKPQVVLRDEPPYCKALEAAPPLREPELETGTWLILCFAAWSMPDISAIAIALEAAKSLSGGVQLGLRPFEDAGEHAAWCPAIRDEFASPLWVVLSDGRVCATRKGLMTAEALVVFVKLACAGG